MLYISSCSTYTPRIIYFIIKVLVPLTSLPCSPHPPNLAPQDILILEFSFFLDSLYIYDHMVACLSHSDYLLTRKAPAIYAAATDGDLLVDTYCSTITHWLQNKTKDKRFDWLEDFPWFYMSIWETGVVRFIIHNLTTWEVYHSDAAFPFSEISQRSAIDWVLHNIVPKRRPYAIMGITL